MKIMVDPNAPASVRVRAADSIFNHSAKAIEIEDIEARVSELEPAAEIKAADGEMTRNLVQRLKRLEMRCGPTREPRKIVIEIVGPEKEVVRTPELKGGQLEWPKDHQHETDRQASSPPWEANR